MTCVAVGVAGVVALQTAALTVQNALTSNIRATNGGDVSVASDAAPLSPADLTIFRRLQRERLITTWTAVSTERATTVSASHNLIPFDVLVVTAPPYPLGGDPTFVSPSNAHVADLLRRPGDVYVTSVLAQELGVRVGSRLLVNGIGGPGLRATVRGIVSESSFEHSSAMTVERRDAAALSNRPPRYTSVYANVFGSPTAVAQRLRSAFPAATVQTVQEALQTTQSNVHDFDQFMLLVGLLALLIAGIGTLNAMQSMLARRRLEIAMLKAMGFGQSTLYGLFGMEALIIGLIGGVVGTALGAVMSKVISDALARAEAIQVTFVLDRTTLIAGVGLGVGAALVFAVLPIVRAAGFRPLEILREGSPMRLSGWPLTIGLAALLMLLFGALAALTLGDAVLAAQFVVGTFIAAGFLTGAFALIVGWISRLGPTPSLLLGLLVLAALAAATIWAFLREPALGAMLGLATLLWALTVLLPERAMLPLTIAARSMSRRRARTSVTLVAFLVGVLSMTITLTVAISLRSQIDAALASNGSTNLVAIANPGDEQRLIRSSRSLPGVRSRSDTTVVGTNPVAVNGRPLVAVIGPSQPTAGGDPEDRPSRLLGGMTGWNLSRDDLPAGMTIVAGRALDARDVGTNHVLLRYELQDPPFSLQVGDTVTVRDSGTGRSTTLRVVGFYQRPRRGRAFGSFFTPPIYADRSLAIALGGSDAQTVGSFSIDPTVLTQDATTLQRTLPGTLVIDVGDLTAAVETLLNELLNLLAVITALVLGAGVAVVANGVALAMMERRREIALFKAIGFGPGRVLQFVLVENALIGSLAGAVSVLCTAIALRVLSNLALAQAVGFDPVLAVVVLVIATGLAVVTAYVTARTPLRVRPIEALRNE
ncbi:MAG: FtsX-like permease family protein [Chloroflexi bacterium]|nr:FtsX-like permease family protein [Chloroflexota bacterium]